MRGLIALLLILSSNPIYAEDLDCDSVESSDEPPMQEPECAGQSADGYVMSERLGCGAPIVRGTNDPDGDGLGSGRVEVRGQSGLWIVLGCDNCPDVYNPQQDDSDGDGFGDACPARDPCESPPDPTSPSPSEAWVGSGPPSCANVPATPSCLTSFALLWVLSIASQARFHSRGDRIARTNSHGPARRAVR